MFRSEFRDTLKQCCGAEISTGSTCCPISAPAPLVALLVPAPLVALLVPAPLIALFRLRLHAALCCNLKNLEKYWFDISNKNWTTK